MERPTESLADFIARRSRELRSIEAQLQIQMLTVTTELEQLRLAASAAGVDKLAPRSSLEGNFPRRSSESSKRRRGSASTIKEAVVSVLGDSSRAMTALEILETINRRMGLEYPRSSLSPQLSRLKSEGTLTLDENHWDLADRSKASGATSSDTINYEIQPKDPYSLKDLLG